jgi:hypothetical protein
MINITNELSDAPQKSLKEETMDKITEKLIESYKTRLTRKYKMHSRNIKTQKMRNLRRHRILPDF